MVWLLSDLKRSRFAWDSYIYSALLALRAQNTSEVLALHRRMVSEGVPDSIGSLMGVLDACVVEGLGRVAYSALMRTLEGEGDVAGRVNQNVNSFVLQAQREEQSSEGPSVNVPPSVVAGKYVAGVVGHFVAGVVGHFESGDEVPMSVGNGGGSQSARVDAGIGIVDKGNSGMRLKVEGIKGTGDGARSTPETYSRARSVQTRGVSTDGKEGKFGEVAKNCWELNLAALHDTDRRGMRPIDQKAGCCCLAPNYGEELWQRLWSAADTQSLYHSVFLTAFQVSSRCGQP